MDRTTETIAHFIGQFRLTSVDDRLTQTYETIDQIERVPEPLGEVVQQSLRITAAHSLKGYDPALVWQPQSQSNGAPLDGVPQRDHMPAHTPSVGSGTPINVDFQPLPLQAPDGVSVRIEIPPPASVVNFTWQSAWLSDDDLFYDGDPTDGFAQTGGLHAAFNTLVQLSGQMGAFEAPEAPPGDWAEFAEEVLLDLEEVTPGPASGPMEVHLREDADATGVVVDGETVDELPVWSDHLPAYLRAELEKAEASAGEEPEAAASEQDGASSGQAIAGSASSTDEGTAVVRSVSDISSEATEPVEPTDVAEGAGPTESTEEDEEDEEETEISAPTVADVLVAHDFAPDLGDGDEETFDDPGSKEEPGSEDGPGHEPGHEIVSGANLAINEVSVKSAWLDAPVMVVQGDVVKVEAVSQVNVLAGNDQVSGDAESAPSRAMNVAEFAKRSSAEDEEPEEEPDPSMLPQNWTVTRIAGDVQAVNWVKQQTFATDFDRAVVETTANSINLVTGGNEIFNLAHFWEAGQHFDLIFVSGDMIDVSMASQTNVLFDSDMIDADGEGWSVWAADNLLYNQAVLTTRGIDEVIEMKEAFAEAAADLAAGAETIGREIAQDALFAGTAFLRVLQIDGDWVTANVLEQINHIGDADRIREEMEAKGADLQAKLIAGANALVNLASIEKTGLDSKIMAAGQVYEDAMLYQAELIEETALPTGVNMTPLVNEAVAFLAEGLVQPPSAEEIREAAHDVDLPGDSDVMQTMLA